MQHNTQSAPLNNMSIEASLNSSTGSPYDNPPTGLLTKTQPGPWAGFSRAGLGNGRVWAMGGFWRGLLLPGYCCTFLIPSSYNFQGFIVDYILI